MKQNIYPCEGSDQYYGHDTVFRRMIEIMNVERDQDSRGGNDDRKGSVLLDGWICEKGDENNGEIDQWHVFPEIQITLESIYS